MNELEERVPRCSGRRRRSSSRPPRWRTRSRCKLHARPGDVLLAEEHSTSLIYEYGGPGRARRCSSSAVLQGVGGRVTPEQVREVAYRAQGGRLSARRSLGSRTRTTRSGGRVWPLDELDGRRDAARDLGLAVHLDGARLLNAAVARG